MTPQAQTILDHLIQQGSITNVEANAVHRCRSVSRRITEIQDEGHPVTKEWRRDTTGQRYLRYAMPYRHRLALLPDLRRRAA